MTGKSVRALTADETGHLIALGSILLGAGLYLYPPLLAGFPVNDGGLFYIMIRAIQQNGFRLPDFVQYNGLSIPFVYPPLGFYFGAFLSSILKIDPLRIIQWFPAFTLVAIGIAFYYLAARMLHSSLLAGMATFLYVSTPRSMTWLVMGGGLTRGLGQLLLILTVLNVYALFTDGKRRFLILSIVAGALVIVAHPEASLHTVAACALLWLFKGRSRRGLIDAALVAVGAAALSAVWWLPKILQFGLTPFTSAAQTGLHTSVVLIYPLFLTFTEEPTLGLIAALGLIGLVASLIRREFLLPIWMLLPFVMEPRGAATVAIIPLAMMGAVAVAHVLYPALTSLTEGPGEAPPEEARHRRRVIVAVAGYLGLFLLVMATYAALQLSQVRLSSDNQTAFAWVAANTPPQSRFLILTGDTELFCDPVQEWFPALTGRLSGTTIQGYEWQSNGSFFVRVAQLQDLQRCLSTYSPLQCVQDHAQEMDVAFDYIYLQKQVVTKQLCRAAGQTARGGLLAAELRQSGLYQEAYSTDAVEVYVRDPNTSFAAPALMSRIQGAPTNQAIDSR